MATTTTTITAKRLGPGRPMSETTDAQPEVFRLTPLSEREGSATVAAEEVRTSRAPLSAKEQRALDHLAMLFTVQEERCLSEARRNQHQDLDQDRDMASGEGTQLSKASLSPSQAMAADASFIYQHIDFQVLHKCVPGFVKSHVNRNCRYLPETFILRVNYWRRRKMIGDDSSLKRSKKEAVDRSCTQLGAAPHSGGTKAGSSSRPATVVGGVRHSTAN